MRLTLSLLWSVLLSVPLAASSAEIDSGVVRYFREHDEPARLWVFFRDKALSDEGARTDAFRRLEREFSARALWRRSDRRTRPGLFDESDLPVAAEYVDRVAAHGVRIHQQSRWLNAVSVSAGETQVAALSSLPFISRIKLVAKTKREAVAPVAAETFAGGGFYGAAEAQLELMNLPALHDLGFDGSGMVIGVLDTGFVTSHQAFNHPNNPLDVVAAWDFINDDPGVGIEAGDDPTQHEHGTIVLGTMAAFQPNVLVGGAYDASYILCKTEDVTSETQVEEDNYVAGLEFIERNGGDVATSSVGYIDWYTQADLDGETAVTTQAVNIATGNGLVCVTAAGNDGNDQTPSTSHLLAPADAFDVLTCGSINLYGEVSTFSADGPTADGRTKPELMTMGEVVASVSPADDTTVLTASGTSMSTPLLAAAATCLLQADPGRKVTSLRQRLFATAAYFGEPTPDPLSVYGYGVVNALDAHLLAGVWQDEGGAIAGSNGTPLLTGAGALVAAEPMTLSLSNGAISGSSILLIGFSALDAPFKGGTMVPFPDFLISGLALDENGELVLTTDWAKAVPAGTTTWFQHWIPDAGAVQGLAASNGLSATTP